MKRRIALRRDPWCIIDAAAGFSARRPNAEPRMRRPHVYERSAPRRRREDGPVGGVDRVEAARSVARAMPALMAIADGARLEVLASLLDAAWAEAERIEGEAGRP